MVADVKFKDEQSYDCSCKPVITMERYTVESHFLQLLIAAKSS